MSATSNTVGIAMLHRASWLVPVNAPPIQDGAVLVADGLIQAAGRYREVKSQAPTGAVETDHGAVALMPGLVNAHTHIELSLLRDVIPLPQDSFASWLGVLFAHRASQAPAIPDGSIADGMRELAATGTALFGDITNGPSLSSKLPSAFPFRHTFLEVLGFDCNRFDTAISPDVRQVFLPAAEDDPFMSLAAHACYSTSSELIRRLKEWCRKRGRPFSIHVAEHPEEMEFLRSGTGFCRELLESLGRWVPYWRPPGISPIRYLDVLGVLDSGTLLVHAVHMDETDLEIAAKKGCVICFCPRSNRNLNTGQADMEKAMRTGSILALGTDSLASNTDLNLFAEGAYVLDNYPGIHPEAVLSMMTLGGAKALRHENRFGSLEAGKAAAVLAIPLPDSPAPSQLIEAIIYQGKKGACQWAICPANN